jgi:uncharacterized membrane protein
VENDRARKAAAGIGLWVVLLSLFATLAVGSVIKAPCASGNWSDGRQYKRLCYTDILPLYGTESLTGSRLPYLNACPTSGTECDEYPVLTMYFMRLAAWASSNGEQFFIANSFGLVLAAGATAVCLWLLVGRRALYFALAPTLAIYAFMNWDLLAVAFATAAIWAYLRRRPVLAGVLLALGGAAKMYPLLLAIPLIADAFDRKEPDEGIHLGWATAGTWLAVNIPFVVFGWHGWSEFFRFNSQRPADWDSLWFIGCSRFMSHQPYCPTNYTKSINVLSAGLFVLFLVIVWWAKSRRDPGFARWTMAFPIVAIFLLTNKVFSPQYGLWLLPFFALVIPRLWLFVAFELADTAVFITRFSWFARLEYAPAGLPIGAFQTAVIVRDLLLLVCLIIFVLQRSDPAPRLKGAAPQPVPNQGVAA